MKKILLGTTALVGAALISGAALAESPKVTLGGNLNVQAGFADQDLDAGMRDYNLRNDTEVKVSVDGKSDRGLGYGAVIELEADVSADVDGEGLNADKTYLYLQGNWGRWEMGANSGAAQALGVSAATFAKATGGVDGDFYYYTTIPSGFIIFPDLPVAHGAATAAGILGAAGSSEDANKITYYTPRMSGFQLGASFTPDAGTVGQVFSTDVNGDAENIFEVGVNYAGQWNQIGIVASATGEWGGSESAATDDLAAWALGLNVSWAGWTFGGNWGDWQDSLMPVGASDSDFYSLGLAYDMGPWGASVTWLDSDAGGNDFNNLSIGADYKLAPGLVPYAEINLVEYDTAGAGADNDATVVIVGSQLTF